MTATATRKPTPFITEASLRDKPFPVGLWAHTFDSDGTLIYQVRILRVDTEFAWCLMFSFLDGSGNMVQPLHRDLLALPGQVSVDWRGWKFYPSNEAWIEAYDEYAARKYGRDR